MFICLRHQMSGMSSKSYGSTPKSKAYSKTAHDWFLANSLFHEIEDGDYRSLKQLIVKKGADPNVVLPERGIAPMHLVVGLDDQNFCYNALKLFLSHGGDPNSRSSEGMTPVHIAAVWGRTAILKLLLKHGGDPWALDNENNNAFSYAHEENHWSTLSVLDDYKNSIIFERPDKNQYRLKLDSVKIFKNDVCAEYKADPVSSICRSTQTVQKFPSEIILNCPEGIQLPNVVCKGSDTIDLRVPVSGVMRQKNDSNSSERETNNSDRSCYNLANNVFDMNFDFLPKDQQMRANAMINHHRQSIDILEYNPSIEHQHIEGYDADEDQTKSSIEEQNNDVGYSTGSHSPSVKSNKGLTNIFKRNSKSAGLTILNTSKDWMVNITQRRKLKNSLHKLQDTCCDRLKLDARSRKCNSAREKGDSSDTLITTDGSEKLNGIKASHSEGSTNQKSKVSHLSVSKSLRRVSSDFNRKLNLVFGNGRRYKHNDASQHESEVYVNEISIRRFERDDEMKRESTSSKDVSTSVQNVSKSRRKSETMFSHTLSFENTHSFHDLPGRNSRSSPEVKTSLDAMKKPLGNTNEIFHYLLDHELDSVKSQYEYDKRMKLFLDEVLTEDESRSSQQLEHEDQQFCTANVESSTEANESQISSDKFFSCASTEENILHENDNFNVVNFNYAKNYLNTPRIREMNGDCSSNAIVKKYGWSIVDSSGDENVNINEITKNSGNKTSGVAYSTPAKVLVRNENQNDNLNNISEIPNSIDGSPVVTYSNSNVSECSSVGTSRDSLDLFENNICPSQCSIDSNDEDVQQSNIKATSSFDVDICDEPLKKPLNHSAADLVEGEDVEVSITEEYLYTDEDDGVQLVEECHLPAVKKSATPTKESTDKTNDLNKGVCTATDESESALSSVDIAYETDELRRELKEFGLAPGPITNGTKRIYLRKLKRFRRKPRPSSQMLATRPEYCSELERMLQSDEDLLRKWSYLELEMCTPFQTPNINKRWREGVSKGSFTYLLLDPRITQNLPVRSTNMTRKEQFLCFLEAIFYIGRGKRSRPYSHLYEALSIWNRTKYPTSKKVLKILDIWRSGEGVICLHVFQNVIPVEAMTREAAMIDAIGLNRLTNEKLGDYYSVASEWTLRKRQQLGVILLAKALSVFLAEGERQLRPPDISR